MLGKGIKGKKQMFIDGLSSLERSRCSTSGPHLAYENFTSSPVDRILNLDVAFFRGLYQLLLILSSPGLKTLLVSAPFSSPWQAGDAGSFRVWGGWKGSLGWIFLSVTQIISWRKNVAVFVLQSFSVVKSFHSNMISASGLHKFMLSLFEKKIWTFNPHQRMCI